MEWRRQITKNPEDDPIDCTVMEISPRKRKKGGTKIKIKGPKV